MGRLSAYTLLVWLIASQAQAQTGVGAFAEANIPTQSGAAWHLSSGHSPAVRLVEAGSGDALPDAPGVQIAGEAQAGPQQGDKSNPAASPCRNLSHPNSFPPEAASAADVLAPCPVPPQNPYKRFLDNGKPIPLSPRQKAYLALRDIIDPFNLLTIAGNSAVTVGIDAHNDYGPGMKGFGRSVGYSFAQDATGEVIGTFGICSLFHEDPHYHRLPSGTPFARVVHAISRTLIAQHDNGGAMPNYEVLVTYVASAEISNLYVPGVHGNGPSTVARIFTGLATDPISNLVTEFLPDFARRFHVRVVFLQQIINQVARGGGDVTN